MAKSKTPQSHIFYVYKFFYPKSDIPCWVGKGHGYRWKSHVTKSHNKQLRGIFRRAGGFLRVEIVASDLTEQDAFDLEVKLISQIGRADQGIGPLVNHTEGGEGVIGHRHNKETRDKLRAIAVSQGFGQNQKGVKKTPEHCAALSLAHKGAKLPPEQCKKIGDSHRGKKRKEGSGDNISAGLKRYFQKSREENGGSLKPRVPAGWKHTTEALVAISAANYRNGLARRKKCASPRRYYWITNGVENARLYDIDKDPPDGWRFGRMVWWV